MNIVKSDLFCHALRLHPDSDFVSSLKHFVKNAHLNAAFILTCVGSLKRAKIRLAHASPGQEEYIFIDEPVEIVSLVGTLSCSGGMHLHISLAYNNGNVVGGHLMPDNSIVHTTAEVVIGACKDLMFKREFDNNTGYKELTIVHMHDSII